MGSVRSPEVFLTGEVVYVFDVWKGHFLFPVPFQPISVFQWSLVPAGLLDFLVPKEVLNQMAFGVPPVRDLKALRLETFSSAFNPGGYFSFPPWNFPGRDLFGVFLLGPCLAVGRGSLPGVPSRLTPGRFANCLSRIWSGFLKFSGEAPYFARVPPVGLPFRFLILLGLF